MFIKDCAGKVIGIRWKESSKFEQPDLDLVNKALSSNEGDRLKRSVYGDKTARKQWGELYRACVRLVRCGEIAGFTLLRNGQLRIKWNVVKKNITKPIPVNMYNSKYLQPSVVIENRRFKDTKLDKRIEYNIKNPHPAVRCAENKFKPYDFAPPRVEIESRIAQDLKYLHSEEARIERVKQWGAETSACDKWNEKFKIKGQEYFSRSVLHTPRSVVLKQHCLNRGYCVWPSPIYIAINH